MTLDDVWREIHDLRRALDRPNIRHVRVTPLGIPGQILVAPMHPDRVRALAAVPIRTMEDGVVDVIVDVSDPRWPREIVVHRRDWPGLLAQLRQPRNRGASNDFGWQAVNLFGIPVIED